MIGSISSVLWAIALLIACVWGCDLKPWGAALALVPLVLGLGTGILNRESLGGRARWLTALISVAVAYAGWRMVQSPVADFARSDALLLLGGFGAFLWTAWLARDRDVRFMRIIIGALALLQVAVACVQAFGDPSFTVTGLSRGTTTFPSGLYGHYNHFANFLLAAFGLAVGQLCLMKEKRWLRWYAGVVIVACLGGIVLSQSRGALLALVLAGLMAGLGWYLDLSRRNISWRKIVLIGLLVTAPIIGALGWKSAGILWKDRAVNEGLASAMQDGGRLQIWSLATDCWAQSPVLGNGARSFSYQSFSFWDTSELWAGSADPDFVHNELLQAAVDYGLIGALLLCAILLGVLLRGIVMLGVKSARQDAIDAGLVIGALAALAGMLGQSMFSFVFHTMPDVLLLGFVLGVVVRQPWALSEKTVERTSARWPSMAVAAVLVILIPALSWRDVLAWWELRKSGYSMLERREAAYAMRPDFRIAQEIGRVHMRLARQSEAATEEAQAAEQWFAIVTQRHPWEYESWANRASMLDSLKRWEETEACYDVVLPLMESREPYYRARAAQANHALRRGDEAWSLRKPEEALAWFLRAQRSIERSRTLAWYHDTSPEAVLAKRIADKIAFLEGAAVKPATLPESKQWEFPAQDKGS